MSESHGQPCNEEKVASCFVEDLEADMDCSSKQTLGSAVSSPAMPSQHHLLHIGASHHDGLDRTSHKDDWSRGSSSKRSSSCLLETDETSCVIVPNVPFGEEATRQTVAAPAADDQRSDSFATVASVLSVGDFCKICHCGSEINQPLIAPCFCSGSLKYVHQDCLQRWIKSSDIKRCELCKYPFDMQAKVKPFCSWELLDLSTTERRKLFCSVTFHFLAIVCVVWSLYILIDRTAEEIRTGVLAWPFWAKLVVVAIGFTGGLVFMYVQCKVYVHLFRKWKAYNRIIVVQDAPEGINKTSTAAAAAAAVAHQTMSENEHGGVGDFLRTSRSRSIELDAGRNGNVGAAEPSASEAGGGGGQGNKGPETNTQKSNAETQTALRGVSLVEVIHGSGGETCAEGAANSMSVKVVTLDGTEDSSTFFLSECECVNGDGDKIKRHGDAAGRPLGEKK